jgi:hypothetical protein
MVNKFDAMTWEGLFGEKGSFKQFFTFEVEDALVSSTKRPIVFCGILHDIARFRGEHVVHFETAFGVQPSVSFLLDSDKAQVDEIVKIRTHALRMTPPSRFPSCVFLIGTCS